VNKILKIYPLMARTGEERKVIRKQHGDSFKGRW
jgi:hypothetical protein